MNQKITEKAKIDENFLDRLDKMRTGDRAILKRASGSTLAESRNALGIFYKLLPYQLSNSINEEIYFLVATLYGMNKHKLDGNFGLTMKKIKEKTKSESLDKRMISLLNSTFETVDQFKPGGGDVTYRLRQCVKLADSKEIGVNWKQLLKDLKYWTHPDRFIQKQSARSYFTEYIDKNKKNEE